MNDGNPVPRTVFDQNRLRSVQLLDDEIEEILELCQRSLRSGSLSAGPLVGDFERDFASNSRLPHALAVSSGSDALEAILRALPVVGRKVLVPTNTFAATAFAVMRAGAQPVLVDMDPMTLAPSPDQLERALDDHADEVAAFVLVHIGGFIGDATKELADLCSSRGIELVEDAAHAHGSVYRGDAPGTWGAAAAYSFFATKVMTSAEGGMVVTNREDVASFVRSYRDQGRDRNDPQINLTLGTNSRMSELHAAVGLVELRRLHAILATRRRIASWYDAMVGGLPGVVAVAPAEGCEPNYYKYILVFDTAEMKSDFRAWARSQGLPLPSGVYDIPLHRQPVFGGIHDGRPLPEAEDFCSRHIALPIGRTMEESDVEAVAAVVQEFSTSYRR
jgi:perosamine synthetase